MKTVDECVYFIHDKAAKSIKIGKTTCIANRLRVLQKDNCNPLVLLHTVAGYTEVETRYHRKFHSHKVEIKVFEKQGGEWFADEPILAYLLENKVATKA